jgi:hypothetical protein
MGHKIFKACSEIDFGLENILGCDVAPFMVSKGMNVTQLLPYLIHQQDSEMPLTKLI